MHLPTTESNSYLDLEGKTMTKVIIMGSGTGIGRLMARTLAQAGHTVYATMRFVEGRNKAKADEVRAFADEHKLDLRPLELDVSSNASIDAAVRTVVEQQAGSMFFSTTRRICFSASRKPSPRSKFSQA
jgi:NAD(P)-dependent dehydrogenase (short-subunit alcohol dehydrogenase family)